MNKIKKLIIIFVALLIVGYSLGYFSNQRIYTLNNTKPVIFAHRGIKKYFPENSRSALIQAQKYGFNALEIDISMTSDSCILIFHDDNCQRLLGIDTTLKEVDYRFIKDKNLFFNGTETREKVVLLKDFLTKIQKDMIVYMDIKEPSILLANRILQYLSETNNYTHTLVADGNIFFLFYLKFKNPEVRTVLEGFNKGKEWIYYLLPNKYRPDFYSSFLENIDSNHIDFLKKNGLLNNKIVYGVDKTNIERVKAYGLKNIILDFDSTMIRGQNEIKSLIHVQNK